MKHGHGNDGLAMPASVAHRGMDLFDFDRRHEWQEERDDGHQHHQSPATAPDPQDGLIAVIGGSAAAAGDGSAVTGFVENFAADEGAYSIAMGEAIFQASAHSSNPAAPPPLPALFSMCRAPISSSRRKSGNRSMAPTMRRRSRNSTTSR